MKNRRWRKRVVTSTLVWRSEHWPFRTAGHIGSITIDYIHDDAIQRRDFMPQLNFTTKTVEAFGS